MFRFEVENLKSVVLSNAVFWIFSENEFPLCPTTTDQKQLETVGFSDLSFEFLFIYLVLQDWVSLCSLCCPETHSIDQTDNKLIEPASVS